MPPACFIQATGRQPGAIGIFQFFGREDELIAALDSQLGSKAGARPGAPLPNLGLRHGWLRDESAAPLDEVMLAKPRIGLRVLMTHGGFLICRRVEEHFIRRGFRRLETDSEEEREKLRELDGLLDALLANCLTQDQAAAVLDFRAGAAPFPARLLPTRRLVLAGPPNVGKSSLFNRLAGYERAFTHEEAGATRDVVDELTDLGGFAVLLGDLPGFSRSASGLDGEAGRRAAAVLGLAEAMALVCDSSRPWDDEAEAAAALVARTWGAEKRSPSSALVVLNKADLPARLAGEPWKRHFPEAGRLRVSSLPGGDAAEKMGRAAWDIWG